MAPLSRKDHIDIFTNTEISITEPAMTSKPH